MRRLSSQFFSLNPLLEHTFFTQTWFTTLKSFGLLLKHDLQLWKTLVWNRASTEWIQCFPLAKGSDIMTSYIHVVALRSHKHGLTVHPCEDLDRHWTTQTIICHNRKQIHKLSSQAFHLCVCGRPSMGVRVWVHHVRCNASTRLHVCWVSCLCLFSTSGGAQFTSLLCGSLVLVNPQQEESLQFIY